MEEDYKEGKIPDPLESHKVPTEANSVLELATGPKEVVNDSSHQKPPRTALCIGLLIILIISAIGSVGVALYFHVQAYLNDREWNDILANKKKFPGGIEEGNYFKGRKLKDIEAFAEDVVGRKLSIRQLLHRRQNLEMAALGVDLLFLFFGLVHFVLFVFKKSFRLRFKITYLGYGIGGVLILAGAICLLISFLAAISAGFLKVRIKLEEQFGNKDSNGNVPHVKLAGSIYSHAKIHSWPHGKVNCKINNSTKKGNFQAQLLSICKVCAYRKYVNMNHLDPCLNATSNKPVFDGKTYEAEDLEALRICPSDDHKMIAVSMMILAAFLSWLIMWLGSNAQHEILEPHYHKGGMAWHPRSVIGIQGWSPRERVPSDMEVVGQASAIDVIIVPAEVTLGAEKEPLAGGHLTTGREDSVVFPSPGSYLQGMTSRIIHMNSFTMKPSVMRIAPELVINPPLLRNRKQDTGSREAQNPKKTKSTKFWFSEYE